MKKFGLFIIIIIIILCIITYVYFQYKTNYQNTQMKNVSFEKYLDKEISCSELTSAINRAIDQNNKNKVEKDEQGFYKENDENSIKIQIKMTDNNKTYDMESIYNGGIDNFMYYYQQIKFKCTKIQYHEKTKLVSYLYFEQIT